MRSSKGAKSVISNSAQKLRRGGPRVSTSIAEYQRVGSTLKPSDLAHRRSSRQQSRLDPPVTSLGSTLSMGGVGPAATAHNNNKSKSRMSLQQPMSNKQSPHKNSKAGPAKKPVETSSDSSSLDRGEDISINVFRLPMEKEPSIISEMMREISPERKQSICKELFNRDLAEEEDPEHSRAKSDIDSSQLAAIIAGRENDGSIRSPSPILRAKESSQGGDPTSIERKISSTLKPMRHAKTPQTLAEFQSQPVEIEKPMSVCQEEDKKEEEHFLKLQKRLQFRMSQKMYQSQSSMALTMRSESRNSAGGATRKSTKMQRRLTRKPTLHTAETIASIMLRPHKERTQFDYDDIHFFMSTHIKFFKDESCSTSEQNQGVSKTGGLTKEQKMACYEALMYKIYEKDFRLCEIGERGDRFYIIIQGDVAVYQPKEVEIVFNTTWELFNFVISNHERISPRSPFNSNVLECLNVINLVGIDVIKDLSFRSWLQFTTFLGKVKNLDSQVLENYPTMNRKRIASEQSKLQNFLNKLNSQVTRLKETAQGSVALEQDPEDQLHCKLSLMDQVATLSGGDSFGQDALVTDDTRNATCICASEKVICAVLTKTDFKRVLAERERQIIDSKISVIQQFQLFQSVTKRKLKNMYRDFYAPKTQEVYTAHRNQYLYRQGDPISGVFCIISGQLKRIKETWVMEEADRANQASYQNTVAQQGKKQIFSGRSSLAPSDQTSPRSQVEPKSATLNQQPGLMHKQKRQGGGLGIVNELRRSKAQQIVLTIIEKGQTIGVEEIVNKSQRYTYSLQVNSPTCVYLFLSARNFKEQFYQGSLVMRNMLQNRINSIGKFHNDLEAKKTNFQKLNNKPVVQSEQVSVELHENPNKEDEEKRVSNLVRGVSKQSSSPSQIRDLADKCARRNEFLTQQQLLKKEQSVTPPKTRETSQSRLSREISMEMQKKRPNVKEMIKKMKQRRFEKAIERQDKLRGENLKIKDSDSKSFAGRLLDSDLCKRFRATYVDDGKRTFHKAKNQNSMKHITEKLVEDAQGIASKWKHERLNEEQVNLMLDSLTHNKRIQSSLRVFSDQLSLFIQYLKQQGKVFLRKLAVPSFKGSLLLQGTTRSKSGSLEKDKKSSGRQQMSSQATLYPKSQSNGQMLLSSRRHKVLLSHSKSSRYNSLSPHSKGGNLNSTHGAGRWNLSCKSRADSQESQLDLMKVFFEWYQLYQKEQFIKRNRTTRNNDQRTVKLLTRAKNTAQDLFNSSQKSSNFQNHLGASGSIQGFQGARNHTSAVVSPSLRSSNGSRFQERGLGLMVPSPNSTSFDNVHMGNRTKPNTLKVGSSLEHLKSEKVVVEASEFQGKMPTARDKCPSVLVFAQDQSPDVVKMPHTYRLPQYKSTENILNKIHQETIPEEDFNKGNSLLEIDQIYSKQSENGDEADGNKGRQLVSKYEIKINDKSYQSINTGDTNQEGHQTIDSQYITLKQNEFSQIEVQNQEFVLDETTKNSQVEMNQIKGRNLNKSAICQQEGAELTFNNFDYSAKQVDQQRSVPVLKKNIESESTEFLLQSNQSNKNIFSIAMSRCSQPRTSSKQKVNQSGRDLISSKHRSSIDADERKLISEKILSENDSMRFSGAHSKAVTTANRQSEWAIQNSCIDNQTSHADLPATLEVLQNPAPLQKKQRLNMFRLRLHQQQQMLQAKSGARNPKSDRNHWVSPLELRKQQRTTQQKNRVCTSIGAKLIDRGPIPALASESQIIDIKMPTETLKVGYRPLQKQKQFVQSAIANGSSRCSLAAGLAPAQQVKTSQGSIVSSVSMQFIPKLKSDLKSQYFSSEKPWPSTTAESNVTPFMEYPTLYRQQTYDHLQPVFQSTPNIKNFSQGSKQQYFPGGVHYNGSPMIIQVAGGIQPPLTRPQSTTQRNSFAPTTKVKGRVKKIQGNSVKQLKVESQEYLRFTDRVIKKAKAQHQSSQPQLLPLSSSEFKNNLLEKNCLKLTRQSRIFGSKYTQAKFGPNHYATALPSEKKKKHFQSSTNFNSPRKVARRSSGLLEEQQPGSPSSVMTKLAPHY